MKIDSGETLSRDDMAALLSLTDEADRRVLYEKAYAVKIRETGPGVYFRGIIELGNICEKDCYYCGIRGSNGEVKRYLMEADEIVKTALWVHENRYGSLVLQAGELSGPAFITMIEQVLGRIREKTGGGLRVTLSLGEQTEETYRRWREAGAHRYLLRIETTNPDLYRRLHPEDHDFEARKACLGLLRRTGYQVGTGVMIGLPGQTAEDLADDILFYQKEDIDMIGMGPYLPHEATPMAEHFPDYVYDPDRQLRLGLNMIAVTRLVLKDVNIAATTALQALHPKGREMGVQAGANVVMPNATDTSYRESYQLYDNKPCLDENSGLCRGCLTRRIESVGEEVAFDEWGDSPHWVKRVSDELSL
ncbi:[FeFe] hydrogenase H-cluster radical SAM maturase HydE [bacterium]|nr:[FeFe] hydrogenase H-cluster radical SAM maturase HydE [bacterium]